MQRLIETRETSGPTTYTQYDENGNKTKESKSIELKIEDMEADTTWTVVGNVTSDSVNVKEGYLGRKLTASNGATAKTARIGNKLDLSTESTSTTDGISFWLYTDDPMDLATDALSVAFKTDSANSFTKELNRDTLAPGWNFLEIRKVDFTTSGTPDWGDINETQFGITADTSKTAVVTIDNLRFKSEKEAVKIYEYDDNDRLLLETDVLGRTTSYTYDTMGNRQSIKNPGEGTTASEFDPLNRETTTTDPLLNTRVVAFNEMGHQVMEKDAKGKETTHGYDDMGRETTTTDPEDNVTVNNYDAAGNKTKETKIDPNGTEDTSTTYSYDPGNRMIAMTDALGQTTSYTVDAIGNQTGIIPPQGPATTNIYDEANLLHQSSVGTQTTTYLYDALGNESTRTEPGNKTTLTRYDLLGRVGSKVDPDNKVTTYQYDINGNQLAVFETSVSVFYTFDRAGRQTKMVDSTGRIKTEGMDESDNPTALSDITGFITRAFDDNNRLTGLRTPNEATTTFGYDQNGAQTSYEQASGILSSFTYDDVGKLMSINATKTSGASVLNLSYVYSDDMNIGTETVSGAAQTYKYDESKQLTEWKKAGIATAYEYDGAGNITRAGDTIYGYDADTNQMTTMNTGTEQPTTFEYDVAGNLTKAISGADITNYVWDGNNRLAAIAGQNTTLTFSYDSENRRLTKTEGTQITQFIYDGIELIAEKDASGSITARYYRNDAGQLISMKKGGANYYFHLNHRGDVVKITDATESVVAEYSYDPWGNILTSIGAFANEQPFRYASYYWDSESGMYYLINRYYDPQLRRFISKDPDYDPSENVSESNQANQYLYAANNPIKNIDPDGLRILHYRLRWSHYMTDFLGAVTGGVGLKVMSFIANVKVYYDGATGKITKLEPYWSTWIWDRDPLKWKLSSNQLAQEKHFKITKPRKQVHFWMGFEIDYTESRLTQAGMYVLRGNRLGKWDWDGLEQKHIHHVEYTNIKSTKTEYLWNMRMWEAGTNDFLLNYSRDQKTGETDAFNGR